MAESQTDRVSRLIGRLLDTNWAVTVSQDQDDRPVIQAGLDIKDVIDQLRHHEPGRGPRSVTQWIAAVYAVVQELANASSGQRDEFRSQIDRLYLKLDRLEIKVVDQLRVANHIAYQTFKRQYPDGVKELNAMIRNDLDPPTEDLTS